MKKVNEILKSIKCRPDFKNIHKYSCYNKLKQLLPKRFQEAIAFFYIKNNILFGALSHPGYKMELNYNKDLINNLLKQLTTIDLEWADVFKNVKKIEFFVSKFHTLPPKIDTKTIPKYKELSKGEFNIKAKDKEILYIFKKIKEDIIINNERD